MLLSTDAVTTENHDVLVLGSGLAGMAAALSAKEAGASVTVIDKALPGAPHETLIVLDANNGEVWAKLEAGTEEYYKLVERTTMKTHPTQRTPTSMTRMRTIPTMIGTKGRSMQSPRDLAAPTSSFPTAAA